MEISFPILILFFFIAVLAGCIDAIAGGGGLITIPAMLACGIPPTAAIATNKLGGVAGTFSSTLHFIRIGEVKPRKCMAMMAATFVGAIAGGFLLTRINSAQLAVLIPFLLIGFSAYFLFSPNIGALDSKQVIPVALYTGLIAPSIGFYDGFFGPGTGAFLAISFVLLMGFNIVKATAHAKLLNFCSNLAALIYFIGSGSIMVSLGLSMMCGQFVGGHIGARLVVKNGKNLIKLVMVCVALAVSAKILLHS